MHEVEVRRLLEMSEYLGGRHCRHDGIEAHVRNSQRGILESKRNHLALNPAKTAGSTVLLSACRQQLHSEADAEHGHLSVKYRFGERVGDTAALDVLHRASE